MALGDGATVLAQGVRVASYSTPFEQSDNELKAVRKCHVERTISDVTEDPRDLRLQFQLVKPTDPAGGPVTMTKQLP